jgi:hypothetical protein
MLDNLTISFQSLGYVYFILGIKSSTKSKATVGKINNNNNEKNLSESQQWKYICIRHDIIL